jgi:WD40 repeat protein
MANTVFISYRRKDKSFVLQLDEALRDDGREVWIDWEDIAPGVVDFQEEIREGIDKAQAVICVLSPEYLDSEYCLMELDYAYRSSKRLVPVVHRSVDPAKVPGSISHINWVYFNGEDNFNTAFRKMLKAIDSDYTYIKTHTDLLIRARQWDDKSHDTSLLLRGNELREAQNWLSNAMVYRKQPPPNELHVEYLTTSQRDATRRRRIVGGISAAVLIITVLALISFYLRGVAADEAEKARAAESEALQARDIAQAAEQEANRNRLQAESARDRARQAQQDAEASADEAQGLALAGSSLLVLNDNDTDLAISLALSADQATQGLAEQPLEIERALATAGYEPGTRRVLRGHNGWVRGVAILQNNADMLALSASHDGGLNLWNLETGQLIRRMRGHDRPEITCVAATPDGQYAVSGGYDYNILLWEVNTGQLLFKFTGHRGRLRALAITPDGQRIVSASEDGTLRVWDIAARRLLATYDPEGNIWVMDVAIMADGETVWAGYNNGTFGRWDLTTGQEIERLGQRTNQPVYGLALTPNQQDIFITSGKNILRYDVGTGELTATFSGHTDLVLSVEVSSNGSQVISSSSDNSVRVWEAASGAQSLRLAGHDEIVWSAVFIPPNGSELPATQAVSGAADGTLRQWDLENGAEKDRFSFSNPTSDTPINTMTLSADRSLVAFGTTRGSLYIMNLAEFGIFMLRLPGHRATVSDVAFSPDGSRLVSTSLGDDVKVWDAVTGDLLATLEHANSRRALSAIILPDSQTALVGYDNGDIVRWNLMGFSEEGFLGAEGAGHTDPIWDMAISPDGRWIATADERNPVALILVWDANTGRIVYQLSKHTDRIRALAFSPDSQTLISGGEDNLIIEWNLANGSPIGFFEGHTGNILSVNYSPNGERVISGSNDRTVRVWDADNNSELRRFEGNLQDVVAVGFLTDTLGVSASLDGTMTTWRVDRLPELVLWVDSNRYVRGLTPNECLVFSAEELCE